MKTPDRGGTRRGSTLVLVLVVGALFGLLAYATADIARGGKQTVSSEASASDLRYQCEAAAELLRLELTNHWERSRLMPNVWFERHVRDGAQLAAAPPKRAALAAPWDGAPAPGCAQPVSFASFPDARAWVDLVGPVGQNWVEVVAATHTTGPRAVGASEGDRRRPTSIRVRLSWGNNPIFDLAMLTVTTNCMFCHLRVNGDVGSIGFFRPGWGAEGGSGANSGHGSAIVGKLYVAPSAAPGSPPPPNHTLDGSTWTDGAGTSQKTLNGVRVMKPDGNDVSNDYATLGDNLAGEYGAGKDVELDYTGAKLPKDTNGDGRPDFPPIDVAKSRQQANGGIGVGAAPGAIAVSGTPTTPGSYGAWKVPLGGTLKDDLVTPTSQADLFAQNPDGSRSGVVDGNLVLVGTYDNPIRLDQDIFVEGDVVIKGYVEGKGGIYAGRNVYIAGDVIYKTPPASWPLQDDAQARDAVANQPGSTELRLAARSNIVVGDWTYREDRDADGQEDDFLRQRDRQGSIFITSQFGMNSTRYYEADPSGRFVSNELRLDAATGKYYNDLDQEVPASRVTRVDDGASPELPPGVARAYDVDSQRYDAAIAPGTVKRDDGGSAVASGHFEPWMSQTEFRGLLGTQQLENGVARTEKLYTNDETRAFELGGNGWDGAQFTEANADMNTDGDAAMEKSHFEAKTNPDGSYAGTGRVARTDGRIVDVGAQTWSTQVQHVDGFLYANKRIAGTSRYAMTVNGGMAAGEIGVLAVYDYQNYLSTSSGSYTSQSASAAWLSDHRTWMSSPPARQYTDPNDPNVRSDPRTKFGLNYDYRLRNGGYGYNLIEGGAGEVVFISRGGRDEP